MADPFETITEDTGADATNFVFWIIAIALLMGIFLLSLLYVSVSGDNGGPQHSPTEEEHHEF